MHRDQIYGHDYFISECIPEKKNNIDISPSTETDTHVSGMENRLCKVISSVRKEFVFQFPVKYILPHLSMIQGSFIYCFMI